MVAGFQSRTRDIAVAAKAIAEAHIEDDREDRRLMRAGLVEMRADGERKHSENRAEFVRIYGRLDALSEKLHSLPVKLIAVIAALMTLLLGAQQLLSHGVPHL
jgi:hypothetical protein